MTEEYRNYKELQINRTTVSRSEWWIVLALCIALIATAILVQFISNRPAYAGAFSPVWLPFTAAVVAAAGIIRLNGNHQWLRVQQTLRWSGIFLMVWVANGLPFDLLRLTPLIPLSVDWPGLAIRTLALASAVVLAQIALARPATPASTSPATWYGYAAFLLALPYPVLRTCWAFGGTLGLKQPGAAGQGFIPWLASIPWLLAAVLSLLLISTRPWKPRRPLLAAGWFATAIVAMIGPAACWSLVTKGADPDLDVGIAFWVPCLFYSSWLLWSIAAGAATRSYQLRSLTIEKRLNTQQNYESK